MWWVAAIQGPSSQLEWASGMTVTLHETAFITLQMPCALELVVQEAEGGGGAGLPQALADGQHDAQRRHRDAEAQQDCARDADRVHLRSRLTGSHSKKLKRGYAEGQGQGQNQA